VPTHRSRHSHILAVARNRSKWLARGGTARRHLQNLADREISRRGPGRIPAKPNSGAHDTAGQLAVLADANRGAGRSRMLACTLYAVGRDRSERIYVHAKVGIVDDRWLTVGSANLNEHSLFNETEMNVVTHDPTLARRTRLRLWSEHLERPSHCWRATQQR
jgi:phosphatidylserine/phosphatidylglycerophosphate/cardiolipin synthase-like enzyme